MSASSLHVRLGEDRAKSLASATIRPSDNPRISRRSGHSPTVNKTPYKPSNLASSYRRKQTLRISITIDHGRARQAGGGQKAHHRPPERRPPGCTRILPPGLLSRFPRGRKGRSNGGDQSLRHGHHREAHPVLGPNRPSDAVAPRRETPDRRHVQILPRQAGPFGHYGHGIQGAQGLPRRRLRALPVNLRRLLPAQQLPAGIGTLLARARARAAVRRVLLHHPADPPSPHGRHPCLRS